MEDCRTLFEERLVDIIMNIHGVQYDSRGKSNITNFNNFLNFPEHLKQQIHLLVTIIPEWLEIKNQNLWCQKNSDVQNYEIMAKV